MRSFSCLFTSHSLGQASLPHTPVPLVNSSSFLRSQLRYCHLQEVFLDFPDRLKGSLLQAPITGTAVLMPPARSWRPGPDPFLVGAPAQPRHEGRGLSGSLFMSFPLLIYPLNPAHLHPFPRKHCLLSLSNCLSSVALHVRLAVLSSSGRPLYSNFFLR